MLYLYLYLYVYLYLYYSDTFSDSSQLTQLYPGENDDANAKAKDVSDQPLDTSAPVSASSSSAPNVPTAPTAMDGERHSPTDSMVEEVGESWGKMFHPEADREGDAQGGDDKTTAAPAPVCNGSTPPADSALTQPGNLEVNKASANAVESGGAKIKSETAQPDTNKVKVKVEPIETVKKSVVPKQTEAEPGVDLIRGAKNVSVTNVVEFLLNRIGKDDVEVLASELERLLADVFEDEFEALVADARKHPEIDEHFTYLKKTEDLDDDFELFNPEGDPNEDLKGFFAWLMSTPEEREEDIQASLLEKNTKMNAEVDAVPNDACKSVYFDSEYDGPNCADDFYFMRKCAKVIPSVSIYCSPFGVGPSDFDNIFP